MSVGMNEMGKEPGKFYKIVESRYRTRSFNPARYYLTYYFIASVYGMIAFVVLGFETFLAGGLEGFERNIPLSIGGFLANLFLAILSTYYGMLANSPFEVKGDSGISSLGSMPSTMARISKSVTKVRTPEEKQVFDNALNANLEPGFTSAVVTRHNVLRWWRNGGCYNWPGKAGGKNEGYSMARTYSWDEVDFRDASGKVAHAVLEWQACTLCNPNFSVSSGANAEAKKRLGFVRVPALSAEDLDAMSRSFPGEKWGPTFIYPYQFVTNRYIEEVPWEVMNDIQKDVEFRASSRVDIGWDPLPIRGSLGMVMSNNAQVRLFGLERENKRLQTENVTLHQTLAEVHQTQRAGLASGP